MAEPTIEFDREVDGRWIAEISLPGWYFVGYGDTKEDAEKRALDVWREEFPTKYRQIPGMGE